MIKTIDKIDWQAINSEKIFGKKLRQSVGVNF